MALPSPWTFGTPSRKSKFAVRPQQVVDNATMDDDLSHLPKDPWLRAMHVLHVGARPDALPCREEEFEKVLRCIGELLEEESGGCVCKFPSLTHVGLDYISTRILRYLWRSWNRENGDRPRRRAAVEEDGRVRCRSSSAL